MESAENVTKLPVATHPKLSPVEFTVTHSLPNGRQITARSVFHPQEGAKADDMLDAINASLDRVRARYEVGVVAGEEDTLDYEIAAHEEAIAKANRELKKLDETAESRTAELKQAVVDALDAYRTEYAAGQAKAEETGRTYDPDKGRNRADLQKHIAAKVAAEDEIKKIESDRAKGHENHTANMAVFQEKLEHLKSKRAARVALIDKEAT